MGAAGKRTPAHREGGRAIQRPLQPCAQFLTREGPDGQTGFRGADAGDSGFLAQRELRQRHTALVVTREAPVGLETGLQSGEVPAGGGWTAEGCDSFGAARVALADAALRGADAQGCLVPRRVGRETPGSSWGPRTATTARLFRHLSATE